jgi:hypothetical protein
MIRELPRNTGCLLLGLLSVCFTIVHVVYNYAVAGLLFAWCGGVQKLPNGWAQFGGVDYAWTTPLYLPGCLIFHVGQQLHGLHSAAQPYGLIGFLLLLVGSIISGWTLASVVLAAWFRNLGLLGRGRYRLWLAVAGWIWVYVPIGWTFVYQWTVVC